MLIKRYDQLPTGTIDTGDNFKAGIFTHAVSLVNLEFRISLNKIFKILEMLMGLV
jgi:hypothetical protein